MTPIVWKPLALAGLLVALALQTRGDDGVKKAGFNGDSSASQPLDGPARSRRATPRLSEAPPEESFSEAGIPLPTPTRGGAGSGIFIRPLVVPQCQIKMPEEIHVPVEIAGVIAKMLVEEGAVVKAGQELARLDDRIAKLDVELKKRTAENVASVDSAQKRVEYYRQELETVEKLNRSGSAKREDVAKARTQVELLTEEFKDAQTKLLLADIDHEKAEEALRRHVIKSPVNGVITMRLKHPGEAVQAMEPVLHLVRTDRVKIQGQIDARHADRLKPGMIVEVWPEFAVGEHTPFSHSAAVRCIRILPGDRRIAFGGDDGRVVVVNLATGGVERELKVSARAIRGLAVCPAEPNQLVTCGDDGAIRFWNLADGLEVRPTLRTPKDGDKPVLAVCLDPKNPSLGWTGHIDGRICQWDFANGVVTRSFVGPAGDNAHVNAVTCLSLSPDGEALLSIDDNALRCWKIKTGEMTSDFGNRSGPTQKEVRQVNFSPDGSEAPLNSDGLVQFKRLDDGVQKDVLESPQQSFASFVWMTPTPGLVLTAREDGELQLWQRAKDHRPARLARVYRGHRADALVHQVDFASNGRFFVTCSADRTVKLWAMPTLQELDAERLGARVSFVDPQASPTGATAFHADVDNRSGMLRGNTTAAVVVYPQ
jgi:WD40 repeat protein/uncharacterized coiled-coil protein SlyX